MTRLPGVVVTPRLETYMESLLPAREPVLARLEEEMAESSVPGVGPAVGQLLRLVTRAARCRDAIELGTAVGYSAIWLAGGCSGTVITLEVDPERAAEARRNLEEAGLGGRVQVVEEDAIVFLERGGAPVDCIFNDLLTSFPDEDTVERCFRLCLRRLRPGGLLLADNALRRGEVVEPRSQAAHNVARWNRLVAAEPGLEGMIVPLRDGVSIARRHEDDDPV
ncbi:MAG TPA: O-methyltransferase [Candidatus Dormibacteraeota bacterium]|nr:O-methyltransferase [Candidatus Dormibacteraeota bacterium]